LANELGHCQLEKLDPIERQQDEKSSQQLELASVLILFLKDESFLFSFSKNNLILSKN